MRAILLMPALLFALAACGGGGSSAPADPPPVSGTLTRANYTSYTAPLQRAVLQLADARQFARLMTQVVTPSSGQASVLRQPLAVHPSATALPVLYDEACSAGGSLHVVLSDPDGNGTPSAGDGLTVLASQCRTDANGAAVNGSFTLTPGTLQLNGAGGVSVFAATGNFDNFAVGNEVLNGGFAISVSTDGQGTEQISFSFIHTTTVGLGPTIVQDTTFTDTIAPDGSSTFSVSGSVKIGGVSLALTQPAPFLTPPGVGDAALPMSGVVQLVDASGNLLALTAKTGNLIDFSLFIGGLLVETLLNQLWSPFGG